VFKAKDISTYSVPEEKLTQAMKYIDENKLINANILLESVDLLFKEIIVELK